MANPEIKSILDGFDKFTVSLYRLGISIIAIATIIESILLILSFLALLDTYSSSIALLRNLYTVLLIISITFSSISIHIYDKSIRFFIVFNSFFAIILYLLFTKYFSDLYIIEVISLGFIYVSISVIAIKESFCFKIWGLKYIPLLLASSLIFRLINIEIIEAVLLLSASLLINILNISKWKMPLYFDIGDRSRYQN